MVNGGTKWFLHYTEIYGVLCVFIFITAYLSSLPKGMQVWLVLTCSNLKTFKVE